MLHPSMKSIKQHHLELERSTFVTRLSLARASHCARQVRIQAFQSSPTGPDFGWKYGIDRYYAKGKCIGSGSFGKVYKGVLLGGTKEVAIKIMPKLRGKLSREKTLDKLRRETDILKTLQGSNGVVHLEGCFEDEEHVYLVTEFCTGGDLQKLNETTGPFDEASLAVTAKEVLKIIKACHDRGVLHGDVKPANFLLKQKSSSTVGSLDLTQKSKHPWLVAVDFGCSQVFYGFRLTKRTGTPVYMAPEIYNRNYGPEADVWSVGVMLYQLFSSRFPFWDTICFDKEISIDEVSKAVLETEIPYGYGPWLNMSPSGVDFIQSCLDRNYHKRLTPSQALNHPWLRTLTADTLSSTSILNNIVPSPAVVKSTSSLMRV